MVYISTRLYLLSLCFYLEVLLEECIIRVGKSLNQREKHHQLPATRNLGVNCKLYLNIIWYLTQNKSNKAVLVKVYRRITIFSSLVVRCLCAGCEFVHKLCTFKMLRTTASRLVLIALDAICSFCITWIRPSWNSVIESVNVRSGTIKWFHSQANF